MFLEMRRRAVDVDRFQHRSPCVYLGFERRGISKHLTYYALPAGCETIFFPGCALAATRPDTTFALSQFLQRQDPTMGVVLDCCTKPSHDLGRTPFFEYVFGEMRAYLKCKGIKRILTACPSCHKIFKLHAGDDFVLETVYERLLKDELPKAPGTRQDVTIHDPCPFRFEQPVRDAVRNLLKRRGITVSEMPHSGSTTFCCGEGASVSCSAPRFAEKWRQRRLQEAGGMRMVTYCAGCSEALGREADTTHLLDILFAGLRPPYGDHAPRFPWSCWNRLRLKHRIKKQIPAVHQRERDIIPYLHGKGSVSIHPSYKFAFLISKWVSVAFALTRYIRRRFRSKGSSMGA
jgi:Fe-S oxidoreductase